MSWGTELWDQYDDIGIHTHKGIEFCEKYSQYLQQRCAIEFEYAQKLRGLVKKFQPKKKDEDELQYSWAKAFVDMLKEVHDIAGQHEVIAENNQATVCKDVQVLISELRQERKKHLQDGTKVQEQLKQSLGQLDRSRKVYERAFKEAEKSTDAYRKADADINLSRADVEKTKSLSNFKNQQCEESKNEYASQLQQTNAHQSQFYSQSMPQVFQHLQDMDERRINKIQEFIKVCADNERNVIPIINTCIDGMVKASQSVNAKEDSNQVIVKLKSGYAIPEDIPFDDLSMMTMSDHQGNHATPKATIPTEYRNSVKAATLSGRQKKRTGLFAIFGSSKVDDPKEDFADLPPNQRKKKLQQKIDQIKKDIARETAEREGMLKMKDVYTNNPSLGDPNSLDKKVEENAEKLDSLQQELKKFQNYMADAEGKQAQRRHSASDDSISHSTSDGSVQQLPTSTQVTPTPGPPVYQDIPGEDDIGFADEQVDVDADDEFLDEAFPVIGTCRALYQFEANSEGAIHMAENEEMYVLEQDQGDGWTRVRNVEGTQEGFVPTSYVQCHFYDQDEV